VTCKNHKLALYQNGIEQSLNFVNFALYPMDSLINCAVYADINLNIGGQNWQNGGLGGGSTSSSRAKQIALDDIRITRGVIYG
jgi:hypothetical protein